MKSGSFTLAVGACAAALTAALSAPAPGQEPAADSAAAARERASEQCRRMSSAELQITCLEAALEAAYRTHTTPGAAPTAQPGPDISSPGTSGLGAEQVARREAGEAGAAATGSTGREGGLLSRLNPFRPDEGGEAEDAVSAPSGASGLGSEQVDYRRRSGQDMREASLGRLDSAVEAFRSVPYRRLEVTLSNGQIWRQIRGDSQDVVERMRPSRTYSVTVSESRFGGYELRINEMARTIRVERIR